MQHLKKYKIQEITYAQSKARNRLFFVRWEIGKHSTTHKDMRDLSLFIDPRKSMKNLKTNAVNVNIAEVYEAVFFSC